MKTAELKEPEPPPLNFAFILTDAVLDDDSPLELIPGHVLQKATDEQIEHIKAFLNNNLNYPYGIPYELQPVSDDPNGKRFHFVSIPKEQWRYRVITFEAQNEQISHLSTAFHLCPDELEVGPTFFYMKPQSWGWKGKLQDIYSFHEFTGPLHTPLLTVSVSSLKPVVEYFNHLKSVSKSYPTIKRALTTFGELHGLPRRSRFLALGYFMVLESLITHNPEDSSDSLTRQIKTKLNLLERCFCRQLDRSQFKDGITPKKLWERLYDFRSLIAHGGVIDFKTKELSALRDDESVRLFMREVVKLVLIHALEEPLLILDLQQC